MDFPLNAEESARRKLWLAGHVRDAVSGQPVEGASVKAAATAGWSKESVTNSRGFFMIMQELETVMPGWALKVNKGGYKRGESFVNLGRVVAEDGRITVDVNLKPEG